MYIGFFRWKKSSVDLDLNNGNNEIVEQVTEAISNFDNNQDKVRQSSKLQIESCFFDVSRYVRASVKLDNEIVKEFERFNNDKQCLAIVVHSDIAFEALKKANCIAILQKPLIVTIAANVVTDSPWVYVFWVPQGRMMARALAKYAAVDKNVSKCSMEVLSNKRTADSYTHVVIDEFERVFLALAHDDTSHNGSAIRAYFLAGYGGEYTRLLDTLQEKVNACLNSATSSIIVFADSTILNVDVQEELKNRAMSFGSVRFLYVDRMKSDLQISHIRLAVEDAFNFVHECYEKYLRIKQDADGIKQDADGEVDFVRMRQIMSDTRFFKSNFGTLLLQENVAYVPLSINELTIDRECVRSKCVKALSSEEIRVEKIAQLLECVDEQLVTPIDRGYVKSILERKGSELPIPLQEVLNKIRYVFKDRNVCNCDLVLNHGDIHNLSLNHENTIFDAIPLLSEDSTVQFNLFDDDLEDNDALRLYVGREDGKVMPIYHLLSAKGDRSIKCIIVDKTEHGASSTLKGKGLGPDISRRLVKSLREICEEFNGKGWSFIYYIPEIRPHFFEKKTMPSYFRMASKTKLTYFDLKLLTSIVSRVFYLIHNLIYDYSLKIAHVKSAIGSIMSRNGSHNIGSHVLSALSHNVGTMPDDRIFYQYIQHRMDYIATAVGDFPLWRQPTMFVCDIMRAFLSQAHLLNYISRSEGLCAYQFQNPAYIYQSLPNTSDRNVQHKTIRLHVRRIKDDCKEGWETNFASLVGTDNVEDFITDYPTDGTWNTMPSNGNASPDESASFDRDVAVAIPGGVVGQHAIFTILENIIRNAAKHEWSKLDDAAKVNNDLDVYVDFRDNPRDKRIEVRVWNDRVGDVPSGMSDTVEALKEKVKGSLISPDSGALVRENWGLAEMRISVGYLQNAGIDKIGGIGNALGKSIELIEPIVVQNGKKECLGYKFWLRKPQELLIQVPDGVTKSDLVVVNNALSRFGIELMRTEDILKSKGLAYSYALMGNLDFRQDESNWPKIPFRVLSPFNVAGQRGGINRIACYDGDFYPLKDGVIDEKVLCDKVKVLSSNLLDDTAASKFAWDLLEDIYACWIDYVRKVRKVSNQSILIVDVDGGEGAKGKSLITDADLLRFVFEHSFNSAVRGYLKTTEKKRTSPELAGALYLFVMLKERPVMAVEMLSDYTDNSKRIALQLIRFAEAAKATMPEVINVSATDQDGNSYVDVRWQETLRDLKTKNCLYYLYVGCERVFYNSDGDGYSDVRDFVKYICEVVLEQAKSFLAKYEERIVTLPRSFGVPKRTPRNDKTPIHWKRRGEDDGEEVLSALFSSNRSASEEFLEKGEGGLCYWRHGDDEFKKKQGGEESKEESKIDKALYFEPLSGSQSYLNSISALQQKIDCLATKQSDDRLSVVREMTGMVENALLRVLVIDERATKFLKDHREVAEILKRIGVRACDEKNTGVADFPNSRFELVIDEGKILATDFDIVIIHQGIIDKILKGNSQRDVGNFLETLHRHIRYVVITTGRGTPSNIPPTARVLPFSIIEKTLFKRYPEKLLLVDTVMNILPNERSL